jgi:hypothetical protein
VVIQSGDVSLRSLHPGINYEEQEELNINGNYPIIDVEFLCGQWYI